MSDLSNKTLAVLIGLVLAVSLVGTWAILNKISVRVIGAFATTAEGTVVAEVPSVVSIGMVANTINFSTVNATETKDSATDAVAGQRFFTIENNGTVDVNVTASATALFTSAQYSETSGHYKMYVQNNESDSAPVTALPWNTTATARQLNSTAQRFIGYFNYTDSKDTLNAFIVITVPADESPGAKSSTVTFTASQA